MQDRSKIRSGFNFLSSFYDLFSFLFFGQTISRSQTYFLPGLGKFENVLIFGGGTGKILTECFKNKLSGHYTYVDISDKMILKAKKRSVKFLKEKTEGTKTAFLCGSYDSIPSSIKFDLIITPYVLDCFNEKELSVAMRSLHEKLSLNGKWLFVDFHIPEKGIMKTVSKSTTRVLYFFFHIFCRLRVKELPEFDLYFKRSGLKTEKEKFFLKGMLAAKVYSHQ